MAGGNEGFFWGDLTIRLDAQLELRYQGMGNLGSSVNKINSSLNIMDKSAYLVSREENMGTLEETRADHVGEGMILLVEGEEASRRDT